MLCCRCHRAIPDDSLFCNFCGKRQPSAPPPQRKQRRRPKGTGSVYKRKDENLTKPWAARYQGHVIGYYASSGDAIRALDDIVAAAVPAEVSLATFAQVYNSWAPNHFETVSSKAQSAYRTAFDRAASLHRCKMRDLKTADYQRIIDDMSNMSRSLCEKQRQLFSQLCKYAMQQDIIGKNYAEFLVLPKAAPIKDRILSKDEILLIWTMIDDPRLGDTARIALGLIYTGMRINELLQLRRDDCHIEQRYVVGGNKTAAGKGRTIPMHYEIVPIFAAWWDRSAGSDWLIPSAQGNARDADGVRKSFNSLMANLGIKNVTPHTCRHTAATRMAASHVPTDSIKRILGHTDYAFTADRYTSTDAEALLKDIQQVKALKKGQAT